MAEYRRKKGSQDINRRQMQAVYIDGNTARKLEEAPKPKPKKKQAKAPVRYEKRKPAYGLRYMAFLVLAAGFTLFSCFSYLQVNTLLTKEEQRLADLQQDLTLIQVQNQALEDALNPQIDLNDVYKKATEEFGMISATQDQIVYYDSLGSDYVRQYADIPEGK